MTFQEEIVINHKLPELKRIKEWSESLLQTQTDDTIVASMGSLSGMFGNVIEWNNISIPAKAMRIIYDFNKDNIDKFIEDAERLKQELK